MKSFFADNLFLSIFIASFLLVVGVRFLVWKKKPEPRSDFFSLASMGISFVVSLFLGAFVIAILAVFVFRDVEKKFANTYTDLKNSPQSNSKSNIEATNPRIMIADTAVYENIGEPAYIGKKVGSKILKNNDTIVPVASFKKGGGISGDLYILANHAGKQFWILQSNTLTYCGYAYYVQPLEFMAKNSQESDIFWARVNQYSNAYEKSHPKDRKKVTYIKNDTLIMVRYYNYENVDWIQISRKRLKEQYIFKAERRIYKNQQSGQELAYYIQYGNYCKE